MNTNHKPNAYETITEKIIAALEAGTAPWRMPWTHAGAARSIDGRAYRGINQFLLQLAPFETPVYLTYRKAETLGGYVRKGEKGMPVVFWKRDNVPDEENEGKTRAAVLLKYYHVFNVAQVEGIPGEKLPEVVTYAHDPIPEARAIVEAMPNAPKIEKGPRACYSPSLDCVTVPSLTRFERAEEYYSTLFHELAHSTGHKTRLDRKGIETVAPYGSPDYSREELVAEMTAAFLCGSCGIAPATLDNSAAYLANWIKVLKADSKAAIIAAAQAQKAADYIRAIKHEPEAAE